MKTTVPDRNLDTGWGLRIIITICGCDPVVGTWMLVTLLAVDEPVDLVWRPVNLWKPVDSYRDS